MSQRAHASSPSSSTSLHAAQTPPLTATSSRQQSSDAFSSRSLRDRTVQGDGDLADSPLIGFARPPERSMEATTSRGLGVQSILNPPQPEPRDDAHSQQNMGAVDSFRPDLSVAIASHPPLLSSTRVLKRPSRASPPSEVTSTAAVAGQTARRVLTPKSPRAASLSVRRNVGGASSFAPPGLYLPGEVRLYTAEPSSSREEIPSLPATTALPRQSFSYPALADPTPAQPRRASGGYGSGPGPLPNAPAQSESPSTTHSPYSQFSQTSPFARYGQPPFSTANYPQPPSRQATTLSQHRPNPRSLEAQYDIGQGTYQMTLDTEQGPMIVPVELDVQQASKMADEKRKRNAGASARFRERRKQKEREAAQTIAGLEREIKDITEERDFYIAERNFFRDVVARKVGLSQIPPRPVSPQTRRLPLPPPPATPMEGGTAQWPDPTREHTEASLRNPNQQRTAPYQPAFLAPTSAPPMIQAHPASFAPPYSGGPPPFPPAFPDPRSLGGPSPAAPPPPPRRSSYDPFRGPYDRSRNPGR